MLERVLAPLDGSGLAEAVLSHPEDFAARFAGNCAFYVSTSPKKRNIVGYLRRVAVRFQRISRSVSLAWH
jgi:hypothetical protein